MIRKGLLLSLLPLAVIFGLGVWGYLGADPAGRYPMHWGLDGRPDRYAGRTEAFLTLPTIALVLSGLMIAAPSLDPRGDNLRRSSRAVLTGWLGVLGFLTLVQAGLTLTALGFWSKDDHLLDRLVIGGAAMLLAVLGDVFGKLRPNWIVGVRTPWTLSSDFVWERTHRVAGRVLVAVGLLGAVAAFVLPLAWAAGGVTAGVLGAAAAACIHSYLLWRRAPDKAGPSVVRGVEPGGPGA